PTRAPHSFPPRRSSDLLLPILDTLRQAVRDDDYELVRETLLSTVQGYSPTGEIVDLLYQQHEEEAESQRGVRTGGGAPTGARRLDRKSTRLNSSHVKIS